MTTPDPTTTPSPTPQPVRRSGLLLLSSAGITSVLGLAYWVVAARVLDPAVLGRGSAMLSAVLLVTSVGTAGLKRGLIRFVSDAGAEGPRLVRRVYAMGLVAMALVGAAVTVWALWADAEITTVGGVAGVAVFFISFSTWGIFVLQDAALIGAHRTALVPMSNTVFSVLKIGALALLAAGGAAWGLLASWIIPAAAIAIVVNAWLFRSGFPRATAAAAATDRGAATPAPPSWRDLLQFTGAEYTGTLLWHASLHLTPLIIVVRAGDEATAAWYVAFQIAYALFVISSNVCDALVAESTRDGQLGRHLRHAGRLIAGLLVPAVLLTVLAAPWIMGLFGSSYGSDATMVLRLLAVAAIPNAISTVVVAIGHVHRRMGTVVAVQATMAISTLTATALLVGGGGITAVAAGWLAAQTLTAAVAATLLLGSEAELLREWRVALVERAAALRSSRDRARAERSVRNLVGRLPAGTVPSGPITILSHQHDLLVASVGTGTDRVILRTATDRTTRRLIADQRAVMDELDAEPRLRDLRPLLPRPATFDPDLAWMVQPASPGLPGSGLPRACWPDARAAGLALLEELHATTAEPVIITDHLLDRWVHGPVTTVAGSMQDATAARGLAVLHDRLTTELLGRPVTVARLHGDPTPDNFLFDTDGGIVNSVVDWESTTTGLPECDLVAYVLACRRQSDRRELGDEVAQLLEEGWRADEAEALGTGWSANAHLRPTTLVLLAWLHHVAANLEKAGRYGQNRWWIHANVDRVLRELAADAPGPALDERTARAADTVADEPIPRRPWPVSTIRWAVTGTTFVAWIAWTVSAPTLLRVVPVLLATVVLPTLVLGRALAVDSALLRTVVAAGGAIAANVVISEVLLYTGQASPGTHLLVIGSLTLAISFLVPRYIASVPPALTPPVVLGRPDDELVGQDR